MTHFWFFAWNQRETYIADLQFLAFQAKLMQRLFRTTRGPALSVYEEWMLDRCLDVNLKGERKIKCYVTSETKLCILNFTVTGSRNKNQTLFAH